MRARYRPEPVPERRLPLVCATALAACSPNPAQPQPAPVTTVVAVDAGVDGVTTIGSADPSTLDPDPVAAPPKRPRVQRPSRPVEIVLRSTPPGARAAVDSVEVGITPTTWFGDADGTARNFTFALRGHAAGRYYFVPAQSGVVHARLLPIRDDSRNP